MYYILPVAIWNVYFTLISDRIFDALHLALITHCIYYYLVTNYANISALKEIVWSFKVSVCFGHQAAFNITLTGFSASDGHRRMSCS